MDKPIFKVRCYNAISESGLALLPKSRYQAVQTAAGLADIILLRSHKLDLAEVPETVLAVGRAGVGVNTIPVEQLSARGIPVFNAPGANANAVKELVLAGMLLAARRIFPAWQYTQTLPDNAGQLQSHVEQGKRQFVGFELPGKVLGVIGLGAVGVKVANAAHSLGLSVLGYDPHIGVSQAWALSPAVRRIDALEDVLRQSHFVTLHAPLNETTRYLLDATRLGCLSEGAILLNFARSELVDERALAAVLVAERLQAYVTDFPSVALKQAPNVINLPHLGASTLEAEENCAVMVVQQVRRFIERGELYNAVNFPNVNMPWTQARGYRIAISNVNVPNMVAQISQQLAAASLNILNLVNHSRGNYAYTLIDVGSPIDDGVVEHIKAVEGVLSARVIHYDTGEAECA